MLVWLFWEWRLFFCQWWRYFLLFFRLRVWIDTPLPTHLTSCFRLTFGATFWPFSALGLSSLSAHWALKFITQKIFTPFILYKWEAVITKFKSFGWFVLLLQLNWLFYILRNMFCVIVRLIFVIFIFEGNLIVQPPLNFCHFWLFNLVLYDFSIVEQSDISRLSCLVVSCNLLFYLIE